MTDRFLNSPTIDRLPGGVSRPITGQDSFSLLSQQALQCLPAGVPLGPAGGNNGIIWTKEMIAKRLAEIIGSNGNKEGE